MKTLQNEKWSDLLINKSDGSNEFLTKNQSLCSIDNNNSPTIAFRKVAIICADGVSEAAIMNIINALLKEDAKDLIVAPHLGTILTDQNGAIAADFSFLTAASVQFDAIYIPHGLGFGTLLHNDEAMEFLNEAYKHCKVIGADGKAAELINTAPFASKMSKDDAGIIVTTDIASETFAQNFIAALGKPRFWEREPHLYS